MADVSPVLCVEFNGGICVLTIVAGRSVGGCGATGDVGFTWGGGVTGLAAMATDFVAMIGLVFFTGSALTDDNWVPPASNFPGSKFG
ncbi:hypothetical protein [uncultured Tolumonas sp.]|uniref:hypothetical protein n=1 Tax=uncultured Tolumonas sp. TaxID=263765 RepID=UPI002A0A3EBD|nr:hypothetical protein [uncultured Tolumonas sp.]